MITSRDVARLAGVSQPSVSRALRDQPGVSAATRKRIRDAARALGYVPSSAGRSLVTRTTGRVAIVSDELSNPFYPALVAPLHDALDEAGYRTILVTDSGAKPVELETLVDGSLDGVLLTTTTSGSLIPAELSRRGVPYVLVNRWVEDSRADACVVANEAGARAVAKLLTELGHKRVAAIVGPSTASTAREREAGFRTALAERGVALRREHVQRGNFDHQTGRSAFTYLMGLQWAPTAVFCANDVLALGALDAAHTLHLNVPGEVTVIGFDDVAMAGWDIFGLTTVRADLHELARRSAALLIARIAEPSAPFRHIEIAATLALRRTHAPPQPTRNP